MIYKNKKSISALIATILLIAVAVAMIAILFAWSRGFTKDNLATPIVYDKSDLAGLLATSQTLSIPTDTSPERNKVIVDTLLPPSELGTLDRNIVGYKIISNNPDNFIFINSQQTLDTPVPIDEKFALDIPCYPEKEVTVQVYTSDNKYIDFETRNLQSSTLDCNLYGTYAKQVSLGSNFTCVLLNSGVVKCWGKNDSGQLGNGTTTSYTTPNPTPVNVIGLTNAIQIGMGTGHSCALLTDRTIKCWGANTGISGYATGQLGDGTTTMRTTPVSVVGITNAKQVSLGGHHTCALLTDGTIKCWGANRDYYGTPYGYLGDGTSTNSPTPVSVVGITNATQISLAFRHSCAILTDGTVKCWGSSVSGQLGNGSTTYSLTPVTVTGITNATQVAAGSGHTCALLSDGTVKCWGSNYYGQLGDGTTTTSYTPVSVSGITTAKQIMVGASGSCALLTNNTMKCWGANTGDGTATSRSTPVDVIGISTAKQAGLGDNHSCTVLTDGTVKCWGSNWKSQLGDGTTTDSSTPVNVLGITTGVQIYTGTYFTCALLTDGTVKCWGYNDYGRLGNGTMNFDAYPTPAAVLGITTAIQLNSSAANFSCAILSDHTIKCWGRNSNGQIGNGSTGSGVATPAAVSGISTATQISLGNDYSCALLSDGTIKTWGANDSGQLGDGTTTQRTTPVTVSGITTATQVSCRLSHSCALLSDGTMKCWGSNTYGQFGNGTTTNSLTPVSVSGITTATQIVVGEYFSCARLSDSTIKCWGTNGYGQTGAVNNTQLLTPSISVVGIPTLP